MTNKMFRSAALLLVTAAATACKTLSLPLPGTQVGRPHAAGSEMGVRMTSGVALVPTIQDVAPEVRDPDGYVINPIPGEAVIGADGQPLRDDDGKVIEETDVYPMPTIELAMAFKKNFEFGLSLQRGIYGMWDIVRTPHTTITISPAYAANTITLGSADMTVSAENVEGAQTNDDDEDMFPTAMEGHVDNFNVTLLGALRAGNPYFLAGSIYTGLGLNQVRVRIKDRRTDDKQIGTQTIPTFLLGLYGKLFVFDVSTEFQATTIKQRDGKSRTVSTSLVQASLAIDWY